MELSTKCFLGMVLGVVAGVLFGSDVAILDPLARIFIILLKMTVLPYLVTSLLLGLGKLSAVEVGKLGKSAVCGVLATWVIGLATVFFLSLAFPDGNDSFHIDLHAKTTESPSLIDALLTDNPFAALAEGVVPAVVLFCIMLGVQMVNLDKKKAALDVLEVMDHALVGLTRSLNSILPSGIFVLTAVFAGTVGVDQAEKLGLFLLLYTFGSALLALVVFPAAVALTTPLSYRQVLKAMGSALWLAFGTGSQFVALPIVMEALREIVRERGEETKDLDTVIPIAYQFPHAGTMFNFLFLLFAASSYGITLEPGTILKTMVVGTLALFSGGLFAMDFLLNLAQLPSDSIGLYISIQSPMTRLKAPVAIVSFASVGIWCHYALRGQLRFNWPKLGALFGGFFALLTAASLGLNSMVSAPAGEDPFLSLKAPRGENLQIVDQGATDLPDALQIGIEPKLIPYSFHNDQQEWTGFSIALATEISKHEEVVLVPTEREKMLEDVASGRLDTAFMPLPLTPELTRQVAVTRPYMELNAVVVSLDRRAREMETRARSGDWRGLVLGETFPDRTMAIPQQAQAELEPLTELDELRKGTLDGVLTDEVTAATWLLRNPGYDMTYLEASRADLVLVFPVTPGNNEALRYLNTELLLAERQGVLRALEDHYLLGKRTEETVRRPSLLDFWRNDGPLKE